MRLATAVGGVLRKPYVRVLLYCGLIYVLLSTACLDTAYVEDDARRDAILESRFTPSAVEVLDDVPLRVGELGSGAGLSVGNDLGSRIAGVYWGYPWERQVIVEESVSDALVFHEYVHQADYFGLISRETFKAALADMDAASDERTFIERRREAIETAYNRDFYLRLSLLWDDGITRELIADLAEAYVYERQPWPEALVPVYEEALRIP